MKTTFVGKRERGSEEEKKGGRVCVGYVNLCFRPSDNYRQKMNLNLVDQKNFNRDVVIAGFASYLMHLFDA